MCTDCTAYRVIRRISTDELTFNYAGHVTYYFTFKTPAFVSFLILSLLTTQLCYLFHLKIDFVIFLGTNSMCIDCVVVSTLCRRVLLFFRWKLETHYQFINTKKWNSLIQTLIIFEWFAQFLFMSMFERSTRGSKKKTCHYRFT